MDRISLTLLLLFLGFLVFYNTSIALDKYRRIETRILHGGFGLFFLAEIFYMIYKLFIG